MKIQRKRYFSNDATHFSFKKSTLFLYIGRFSDYGKEMSPKIDKVEKYVYLSKWALIFPLKKYLFAEIILKQWWIAFKRMIFFLLYNICTHFYVF